jgi:predicted  nucleic acid-binding Zn-ribbon protein
MRNKEKKLSDLQILNGKLYEARENIEDKLKQSENIRNKQSELISKLQNEIEQMRKIIRMKTPL